MSSLPSDIMLNVCRYLHRTCNTDTLNNLSQLSPDWKATVYRYKAESIKSGELGLFHYTSYTLASDINLDDFCTFTKKIVIKPIPESLGKDHFETMMMTRHFPNLKEIDAHCNESNINKIKRFLQLKHHDHVEKLAITAYDFGVLDKIFVPGQYENLKTLELAVPNSPVSLFKVLEYFPNLEKLCIPPVFPFLSPVSKFLSKDPKHSDGRVYPKLTSIAFSVYILATINTKQTGQQFESLKQLGAMLPNIKSLSLISGSFLIGLSHQYKTNMYNAFGAVISGFKNLRNLCIPLINESVVDNIEQNCPDLESLSLHFPNISNSMRYILPLQKLLGLSSLTKLRKYQFYISNSTPAAIKGDCLFIKPERTDLANDDTTALSPTNLIDVGQSDIRSISFSRIGFSPRILYLLEKYPLLDKLDINISNFSDIESVVESNVALKSVILLSIYVLKEYTTNEIVMFIKLFPNVRVVKLRLYNGTETLKQLKGQLSNITFIAC